MQRYLTQKQAAQLMQCSIKKLQLLRRSGELKFIRFGYRTVRYAEYDLKDFLRSHKRGNH